MAYDYRKAVKADIRQWMADNEDYMMENAGESEDEFREFLNDTLWTEDSVTGNASGSYTFDREQAKKYVNDNMELAVEACREFDCIKKFADAITDNDYEFLDVTIRCYLLGEVIEAVIDEAEELRGE